jgi:hypothetical protein
MGNSRANDHEAPISECSDWSGVVGWFEDFPRPEVSSNGSDVTSTSWVFRGLPDSRYDLEPSIVRHDKSMSWFTLEKLVAQEFRSHARMHLTSALLPDAGDEFTWLAQMQHYSVPTRLLDFTYSPFVALYFAMSGKGKDERRSHIRLWAVDADAVNNRFKNVTFSADYQARKRAGEKIDRRVKVDDFYTEGDSVTSEILALQDLITESLLARGTRRGEMERQGCVAVASPRGFNRRLASQQAVFLVNCAENLELRESLNKMMESHRAEWCKALDIKTTEIPEIEQRLFQMNIHAQSLFPDMEGLARFIDQKMRLQWK